MVREDGDGIDATGGNPSPITSSSPEHVDIPIFRSTFDSSVVKKGGKTHFDSVENTVKKIGEKRSKISRKNSQKTVGKTVKKKVEKTVEKTVGKGETNLPIYGVTTYLKSLRHSTGRAG